MYYKCERQEWEKFSYPLFSSSRFSAHRISAGVLGLQKVDVCKYFLSEKKYLRTFGAKKILSHICGSHSTRIFFTYKWKRRQKYLRTDFDLVPHFLRSDPLPFFSCTRVRKSHHPSPYPFRYPAENPSPETTNLPQDRGTGAEGKQKYLPSFATTANLPPCLS